MNIYLVIFITLVAALLASFAQLLYKKGVERRLESFRHIFRLARNRNIIYGVILYLISLVVYLYALQNADLSVVYPTFASTFIFITIISSAVFKERIGMMRALGVLLVFLGIVIIATTA